jgi:hypothetical protein
MAIRLLLIKPLRTLWARPLASQPHSAFYSVHRNKSTLRHARFVGTASLLVEDIAASAVFDYAALLAARPLLERTAATCAAKPSNPNSQPV